MRGRLLAILVCLVGAGAVYPAQQAFASPAGYCVSASAEFSPTRIHLGDTASWGWGMMNCSDHTETFLIRTRFVGPCGMDDHYAQKFTLDPGNSFGIGGPAYKPPCVGKYVLVARALKRGRELDRAWASLRVVP